MKKILSAVYALIISIIFPLACISSSFDPAKGKYFAGYFGPHSFIFIVLRYIAFIILIFVLTYLNRNNDKVFTHYLPTGYLVVIVAAYYDYFIGYHFIYNFSYALWLCVSISVACFSLFFSATIFLKDGYKKFYKIFWYLYILTYILIIYISFIRTPDSFGLSVNTHIGQGTIRYFSYILRHPEDAYMVLICIGNILIFIPLSFIIKNISVKISDIIVILAGVIMPLLAEGYQYIFKCGNVDIDDIILNISGFIIGFLLMKLLYKYKKPSETS